MSDDVTLRPPKVGYTLRFVKEYVRFVRAHEHHPQSYCVACDFRLDEDTRPLPPLMKSRGPSRVADVPVCAVCMQWEATIDDACQAKYGLTLKDLDP